jgi:hypothetical protein
MAYTEILKLFGTIVRWAFNGFRGKYIDYCDERYDRANFLVGITITILMVLLILPVLSWLLSLSRK